MESLRRSRDLSVWAEEEAGVAEGTGGSSKVREIGRWLAEGGRTWPC